MRKFSLPALLLGSVLAAGCSDQTPTAVLAPENASFNRTSLGDRVGTYAATATLEDGGSFTGSVAIRSLSLNASGTYDVTGTVRGTATFADGTSAAVPEQSFAATDASIQQRSDQEILTFPIEPHFIYRVAPIAAGIVIAVLLLD